MGVRTPGSRPAGLLTGATSLNDLHFLLYKNGVSANTCHALFTRYLGRRNEEPAGRCLVKHHVPGTAVHSVSHLCPLTDKRRELAAPFRALIVFCVLYKASSFVSFSEISRLFQRVKRFILKLRLNSQTWRCSVFFKSTRLAFTDYESIACSWGKMGKHTKSTKKITISSHLTL